MWIDLIALSCDMEEKGVFFEEKRALNAQNIVQTLHKSGRKTMRIFQSLVSKSILRQREDGAFYIPRVQRDAQLSKIRSEAGGLGGNPDLLNQKNKQNQPSSSSSSSSSSNTPYSPPKKGDGNTAKKAEIHLERFGQFWKAYPRKVGKGKAKDIWLKRKPSDELTKKIIQAVNTQKQSPQWSKERGQFIPHPSTWLNREQWDDEPEGTGQPAGTVGGVIQHTRKQIAKMKADAAQ